MPTVYGPPECRILWVDDPEPYDFDPAVFPEDEVNEWLATYGCFGCVVELRKPACPCCGHREWEHAASLWSIVGDAEYHQTVEAELMEEAS